MADPTQGPQSDEPVAAEQAQGTVSQHAPALQETVPFDPAMRPAAPATAAPAVPLGQIGDYELVREIAHGGMGVVYEARHRTLHRTVALKMIRAGELADAEHIERFRREAEAAAQLDHSGIVAIYDVGHDRGRHYFAMAYVDGTSLHARLQKGPLPAQEAARIVQTVAEAVAFAHAKQIVHRDLKPHNILLDRQGQPKVADFGLAKRLDAADGYTASGAILGTPNYMAPEQALSQTHDLGPAVDVYGLGGVLYATLTGRPPFQAASVADILCQVIEREPAAPRLLNAAVPRDLETICLKCLEKKPHRRYGSCLEVAEELGRYLRGEPILARPVSAPQRLWRWCQRQPVVAALTATAALLVLAVAIVSTAAYFREAHLKSVADSEKEQARLAKAKAQDEAGRAKKAEAAAKQEEAKAEANAAKARTAERKAEENAEQAMQSEEEAQRSFYYASIALANRCLQEGDVNEADRILTRCPTLFRHWEWGFLRDVATRGRRTILPGTDAGQLAISGDGRWIAVGTVRGELVLWDDQLQREVFRDKAAHSKAILAIAFSPDAAKLATTCKEEGLARIWAVPSGEPVCELRSQNGGLTKGLAFCGDGRSVATAATDKTIHVWDSTTGKRLQTFSSDQTTVDLAWPADRQELFVLQADNCVATWGLATGARTKTALKADGNRPHAIRCNHDGAVIAVTGESVRVWDTHDSAPALIFSTRHRTVRWDDASPCELSGDGKTLAVADYYSGMSAWDLPSKKRLLTLPEVRGFNIRMALSSDGSSVIARSSPVARMSAAERYLRSPVRVAMESMTVKSQDPILAGLPSLPPLTLFQRPDGMYDLSSGAKVFAAPSSIYWDLGYLVHKTGSGGWDVRDLASGARLRRIKANTSTSTLSSDGRLAAVAWMVRRTDADADKDKSSWRRENGQVRVFSVETGETLKEFELPRASITALRFSADNQRLAAACLDGHVRLCRWQTGQIEANVPAHDGGNWVFSAIAFSPRGAYLATGGGNTDRRIRVWSCPGMELLSESRGHAHRVSSLQFSRDERRLLSASEDGTLRLWDVPTGQEVLRIEASDEPFGGGGARFIADDAAIMSTDTVGVTRIWGGLRFRPAAWAPLEIGEWVDLLPWLRQSALSEPAENEVVPAAVLVTSSGRQTAPIAVAPAGSYVLRAKLTRTRSGRFKTVGFLLPAGQGKAMLALDHEDRAISGLDQIEKRGVGKSKDPKNPTDCPVQLVDGRSHELEARVELQTDQAKVTVQLDGREIIRWNGPQKSLKMWPIWEVDDARMMGLALADVDVTIERLELMPLDGKTRLLTPSSRAALHGIQAVPAGEELDLLKVFDAKLDAFDATVRTTDAGVELAAEKPGRISLPVWPRGSYELRGSSTIPGEAEVVMLVPTTRSRGAVVWRTKESSGLSMLDGKSSTDPNNPTHTSPSKVQVGRRHAFRVRVVCDQADAEVVVELDGTPYFSWKGPEAKISLWSGWDVPHQRTICLGVEQGAAVYHDLTLKMLDGEAWLLRPKP